MNRSLYANTDNMNRATLHKRKIKPKSIATAHKDTPVTVFVFPHLPILSPNDMGVIDSVTTIHFVDLVLTSNNYRAIVYTIGRNHEILNITAYSDERNTKALIDPNTLSKHTCKHLSARMFEKKLSENKTFIYLRNYIFKHSTLEMLYKVYYYCDNKIDVPECYKDELLYIDSNRGKKSRAFFIAEIIKQYKFDINISRTLYRVENLTNTILSTNMSQCEETPLNIFIAKYLENWKMDYLFNF